MAGASITMQWDAVAATREIERLVSVARDLGPLKKRLGVGLVETTQHRFETATDPTGAPWLGLKPAYAATKRGAGILREKAMRGGLMGSITYRAEADGVRVGSNKVYAAIHQFGGVIRPVRGKSLVFRIGGKVIHAKSVTIPARPYLGIGKADELAILEAVRFTFGL